MYARSVRRVQFLLVWVGNIDGTILLWWADYGWMHIVIKAANHLVVIKNSLHTVPHRCTDCVSINEYKCINMLTYFKSQDEFHTRMMDSELCYEYVGKFVKLIQIRVIPLNYAHRVGYSSCWQGFNIIFIILSSNLGYQYFNIILSVELLIRGFRSWG